MKRFYKDVVVEGGDEGCRILLDGRPVRTPARALMHIPNKALAALVAAEWDGQGETVQTQAMPITRLATTVIDLMPDRRRPAQNEIIEYAGTDMLCYRAETPQELAERQDATWQPWLHWAATALDAELTVTRTIESMTQPCASMEALAAHIRALDDWRLIGVHAATKLTGSAVLAFAMKEAVLGAAEAGDLALLEELFEAEHWGLEEEQAKRHDTLRRDLLATERYLRALDQASGGG